MTPLLKILITLNQQTIFSRKNFFLNQTKFLFLLKDHIRHDAFTHEIGFFNLENLFTFDLLSQINKAELWIRLKKELETW